MIALLLSCGSSYSKTYELYSSTGELESDSVLVSYDDLRKANAKMVELKYEKEINEKLRTVVHNDSVIIDAQDRELVGLYTKINKLKKTRNVCIGVTGGCIISTVVALIFGL